jgi:polysaccharide deacetylase family protein (PEP-CTERM system associated)
MDAIRDRNSGELVNALTIDVEDYFHVEAMSGTVSRDSWSSMEYRCEQNVARLLQLFSDHDVRATFFVLGWVAERSPALVRQIREAGHEVACHGMSHRLIYRQSEEEFRNETRRSKGLLEDITGQAVLGYRAASFSIVKSSMWAVDHLIDSGFSYDSSVFPIRHDNYGMPEAPLEPFRLEAPSGRRIVEFPMAVVRFMGLNLPVSGGGYFRILPYWFVRTLLRRINRKERRPFTFYLHPWEIDPGQPRLRAGLKSRLRHYTNLDRCEARLQDLLGRFRFAPMQSVLRERGLLLAAR